MPDGRSWLLLGTRNGSRRPVGTQWN